MTNLSDYFEVVVTNNNMKASLIQHKPMPENHPALTNSDIINFLKEHGIVFGFKMEVIEFLISSEGQSLDNQLEIAVGKEPIPGEDARIIPAILKEDEKLLNHTAATKIDLKKVLDIPSVKQGELVGEKLSATEGESGTDVFGEVVPAKPGKDLVLRPGKNTFVDEDGMKLFSQIDGQMSFDRKTINVFPVFEVNGDVDMRVGNISFIGNVTIRGNVPTGFEIKAKGDIRIIGTVEAAQLISEGSIYVSAGIVGQGGGKVYAKQDIHTTFINQGNVEAEGSIFVNQSILHSNCSAGGSIVCEKGRGNIVGGVLSTGESIIAKEIGNSMSTATELYVGVPQKILDKQMELEVAIKNSQEELNKLSTLLEAYEQKAKISSLQPNERIMKLRVRSTIELTKAKLENALAELEDIKEQLLIKENGFVRVDKSIFPNVSISFGKYRRKMMTKYDYVKILFSEGEIKIINQ